MKNITATSSATALLRSQTASKPFQASGPVLKTAAPKAGAIASAVATA